MHVLHQIRYSNRYTHRQCSKLAIYVDVSTLNEMFEGTNKERAKYRSMHTILWPRVIRNRQPTCLWIFGNSLTNYQVSTSEVSSINYWGLRQSTILIKGHFGQCRKGQCLIKVNLLQNDTPREASSKRVDGYERKLRRRKNRFRDRFWSRFPIRSDHHRKCDHSSHSVCSSDGCGKL